LSDVFPLFLATFIAYLLNILVSLVNFIVSVNSKSLRRSLLSRPSNQLSLLAIAVLDELALASTHGFFLNYLFLQKTVISQ